MSNKSQHKQAKQKARERRNKRIRYQTEAMRRLQQSAFLKELEERHQRQLDRRAAADPAAQIAEFHENCTSFHLAITELAALYEDSLAAGRSMLNDAQHRFDKLDTSSLVALEADVRDLKERAKHYMTKSGAVADCKDNYAAAMTLLAEELVSIATDFSKYAAVTADIRGIMNAWKRIAAEPEKLEEIQGKPEYVVQQDATITPALKTESDSAGGETTELNK